MSDSAVQIANLLYRYAEHIDAGRLAEAAALFRHASIRLQGRAEPLDADALLALWQRLIVIHPDGTPRTQHVISNPLIEVDETAGRATARSRYTVFQAADGFALQPVVCGRYEDGFVREDGAWRFASRRYLLDLAGDTHAHMQAAALAALAT